MENKIRSALDQITAEEELRTRTARSVTAALGQRAARRTVTLRYAASAAVCLLMLLFLGGYSVYRTPVAAISVDINPSLELSVNRFDRVIDARAFNEEGETVLSAVRLTNKNYSDALEELLRCDAIDSYLAGDAEISITVLGSSETHSQEMLSRISDCTSVKTQNVHCHSGQREDAAAAREAGLSLGKYEAYLILHELDESVTVQDVRVLSMREIRMWIERLGGEENAAHSGSGHGNNHSNGHGDHH